jgi:3-mercaptopyruvate sulfurtransferase SseA
VAQILLQNGFARVRALKGGWNAWVNSGGDVEPKDTGDKRPQTVDSARFEAAVLWAA